MMAGVYILKTLILISTLVNTLSITKYRYHFRTDNKAGKMYMGSLDYKHVHLHLYMLRPICEIVQFMNWAALLPSSCNGQ